MRLTAEWRLPVRNQTDGPASKRDHQCVTSSQQRSARATFTMIAQSTPRHPAPLAPASGTGRLQANGRPGSIQGGAGQAFLTVPFDAMRFQYASAVMAGLVQRSIIASAQLERALDTLEKLILGPLARQR